MAIGLDQAGGLAERAGTSISSYINAVPNGSNLSGATDGDGQDFNVPVTVNGNLTVTGGTVTLPVTGIGIAMSAREFDGSVEREREWIAGAAEVGRGW